jgi:hypothetical protein
VTNARSRTDWSSPQIVITVVLALLAAQSAYFNFNSTTTADVAVLKEQITGLRSEVRELREEVRRGRTDGGPR